MSTPSTTPDKLLSRHSLKRTPTRKAVLSLYLDKQVALTHSEVEEALGKDLDRVTIYRTLNTFEEKGLIHKVPGPDGVIKFALCAEECDEHQHRDEHVHFHCRKCGSTYCFHHTPVPAVKLPKGFEARDRELFVEGVCKDCRKR